MTMKNRKTLAAVAVVLLALALVFVAPVSAGEWQLATSLPSAQNGVIDLDGGTVYDISTTQLITTNTILNLNGTYIQSFVEDGYLFDVLSGVEFTINGGAVTVEIPEISLDNLDAIVNGPTYSDPDSLGGILINSSVTNSLGLIKVSADGATIELNGGMYAGNTTVTGSNGYPYGTSAAALIYHDVADKTYKSDGYQGLTLTIEDVIAETNNEFFRSADYGCKALTVKDSVFLTTLGPAFATGTKMAGATSTFENVYVVLKDDTTLNQNRPAVEVAGGTATFTNCGIVVCAAEDTNGAAPAAAVAVSAGGTANLKSGFYGCLVENPVAGGYAVTTYTSGGTIVIGDGTTQPMLLAANAPAVYLYKNNNDPSVKSTLTVNSGIIMGELANGDGATGNTISIIDGTFVVYTEAQLKSVINNIADGGDVGILIDNGFALSEAIIISENVTINLYGNTISGSADSLFKISGDGIKSTIENGTITAGGSDYGIWVTDNAELTVDNITLTGAVDAIKVGTKGSNNDASVAGKLIVSGDNTVITGSDTAIIFYGKSEVTVNAGKLTGTNYGGIYGSGGTSDGSTLTITGGEIKGGNVADNETSAIFFPNDGTVTISGGSFEGPNGLQMLGSGKLIITGGIFKGTGLVTDGYKDANDGAVNATAALSLIYAGDKKEGYGVAKGLEVSISGGEFTAVNGDAIRVLNISADGTIYDNTTLLKDVKFISGGKFSSNPLSSFLVSDYFSEKSGDVWVVKKYVAPTPSTPSGNTGSSSSSSSSNSKPADTPVEPETPVEEPEAGEPTVETEVTDGGEVVLETPTEGGAAAADDDAKITGVVLPTGTDSEVTFIPISEQAAPAGKETQTKKVFEINVPTYEKGKPATIKFTMTVAELEADGKTAGEVALWHFDEETGEWTKLLTSYTIVDGIVYFEAITYDFSPFAIIYEETPVEEPVEEPETPATPAPILAVLAGLGAAVVLRRK